MAIWAVIALLVLALAGRMLFRTWLAPAALVPLFWAALFEAAAIIAPSYSTGRGGAVVVLLILCFLLGAMPLVLKADRIPRRGVLPRTGSADSILVAGRWLCLASAVGVVLLIRFGVSSLGVSASPSGLLQLGNRMSQYRYGGGPTPTIPFMVSSLCFPACLLLGRFVPYGTKRERAWALIALALAAVFSFVTGARSSVVFGAGFLAAGMIAETIYRKGATTRVSAKVVLAVAGAAMVTPLIAASFSHVRAGFRPVDPQRVQRTTQIYTVGSLAGLNAWLEHGEPQLRMGVETFAGPASLLGLTERQQGLYSEVVTIDRETGSTTNIFTVFRPLVSDFGLPGAALICALMGFLSTKAFCSVALGRERSWLWLAMLYAGLFMSSIVSMFAYNNVTFAWPIAAAATWWATKAHGPARRRRRRRRVVVRPPVRPPVLMPR